MTIIEPEEFRALCRQIGKGNQSAMNELDRMIRPRLLGTQIKKGVPPNDAEDIVSDTLLDLWITLRNKWEGNDVDFINDRRISYVWAIARNKRNDHLRRKMPEMEMIENCNEAEIQDEASRKPDEILEDEQTQEDIIQATAQLPETQREVLHLEFVEGWTPKQIQAHFKWRSQAAVNYHRNRGLQKLREILASPATAKTVREHLCA